MPHRKLVKIGEKVTLPTISQFLLEMATRQHEEIARLKSEALTGVLPDPTVPEEHHENLTPDPWQLHPVRIKKIATKRASVKSAAKKKARSSKPVRRAKPSKTKTKKSVAKRK
jgi:hypothetical protein